MKIRSMVFAAVFFMFFVTFIKVSEAESLKISSFTSLNDAITTIGAANKTLIIDSATIMTSEATIPTNISIIMECPGSINNSYSLSINGPFSGGLYQAFTGDGPVVFGNGSVKEIYPEWWGAKGDGSESYSSIQKAITAALAGVQAVRFSSGIYHIGSTINIDRPVDTTHETLKLIGNGASVLYLTSPINMFSSTLDDSSTRPLSENIEFQNLTFRVDDSSRNAYVLHGEKFLRIKFISCFFDKIKCLVSNIYLQSFIFSNCYIKYWSGYFIRVNAESYDIAFIGNWVEAGGAFFRTVSAAHHPVNGVRYLGNLIEGLSGTVIEGGNFRGLSIVGNYFEENARDGVLPAIELNADGYNYGVQITGNFFSVSSQNLTNPDYWEVDLGATVGMKSGGNYSTGQLYNNTSAIDFYTNDDYSTVVLARKLSTSTFTATLIGCTSSITGVVKYDRHGKSVTLYLPTILGTSNSTAALLAGLPTHLYPVTQQIVPVRITNNGRFC
ncbi:MAG: hypothetical protein AB1498_08685 [bacterium]